MKYYSQHLQLIENSIWHIGQFPYQKLVFFGNCQSAISANTNYTQPPSEIYSPAPVVLFFLPFLPSPFLTCFPIIPTSFGGKGYHLRRGLGFSGVFLSCKVNYRRSAYSSRSHLIITLSLAD